MFELQLSLECIAFYSIVIFKISGTYSLSLTFVNSLRYVQYVE